MDSAGLSETAAFSPYCGGLTALFEAFGYQSLNLASLGYLEGSVLECAGILGLLEQQPPPPPGHTGLVLEPLSGVTSSCHLQATH